jgi:Rod binding domain-containing protein
MGMTDALAGVSLGGPAGGLSLAAPPAVTAPQRQLMQAAKDFESLLVHELLKEMKQTIPDSGSEDSGNEQVQGMFWSFLSQEVANQGGLGLWKSLYRQMQGHLQAPTDVSAVVEQNL